MFCFPSETRPWLQADHPWAARTSCRSSSARAVLQQFHQPYSLQQLQWHSQRNSGSTTPSKIANLPPTATEFFGSVFGPKWLQKTRCHQAQTRNQHSRFRLEPLFVEPPCKASRAPRAVEDVVEGLLLAWWKPPVNFVSEEECSENKYRRNPYQWSIIKLHNIIYNYLSIKEIMLKKHVYIYISYIYNNIKKKISKKYLAVKIPPWPPLRRRPGFCGGFSVTNGGRFCWG